MVKQGIGQPEMAGMSETHGILVQREGSLPVMVRKTHS